VVCTGTVSTGSKSEIKQCGIITILGDRVGAGKVTMLAIVVAESVFSPCYLELSVDKERQ